MIVIYAISSTVFVLWILDTVLFERNIVWSRLFLVPLLFLFTQIVATVFSIDIHTSIFGYYGRFNGGLLSTIAYIVLFFVAVQVFDKQSFRRLLITSLLASMLVFIWGLPGRLLGVDLSCVLFRGDFSTSCWTNEFRPAERMFSTFGQPNWLGAYFATHFFIGLSLFIDSPTLTHLRGAIKEKKLIGLLDKLKQFLTPRGVAYIIYLSLMVLGVVFTASRSSQLGLAVGVLILFLMSTKSIIPHKVWVGIVCAIAVVALVGSIWYGASFQKNSNSNITHSGSIRLIVWEGAIKLAVRYPLFGTGPETFAYSYYLTRPEAHNDTSERDYIYNKAHNELLHILATSGVFGLVGYLALLGVFIKTLFKQNETKILGAAIVSLGVINFFGFSTSTSQVLLYMLPAFAYLGVNTLLYRVHIKKLVKYLIVPTLLGLLVWAWIYVSTYVRADIAYAKALHSQYEGNMETAELFAYALKLRFEHVYVAKFALASAQTAVSISELDTENTYESAVDSLVGIAVRMQNIAIKSSPQNPLYWKDRVRMFRLLSETATTDAEKKMYLRRISEAVHTLTRLAPTDIEVKEWVKGQ